MWTDMANDMQVVNNNRMGFQNTVPLMNDPVALEGLKESYLQHFRAM